MRDNGLRKAAFLTAVLACALSVLSPAQAYTPVASGTIRAAWFGSSGEDINAAAGQQGLVGWTIPITASHHGKAFKLDYPGARDVLLDVQGFKVYPADLNVYFHSNSGYVQPDGTKVYWDDKTGVNQGPEPPDNQTRLIPPGTDRAFVVISIVRSPYAQHVPFIFSIAA